MSFVHVDKVVKGAKTTRWIRFVCWLRGHSPTFVADRRIWCARCGEKVGDVK